MHKENLLADMKFYQDTAVEYQDAYHDLYQKQAELQNKYHQQANLLKEALAAIQATNAEAQSQHQELLDVQGARQAELDQAVSSMVEQYKVQLNTAQSTLRVWDHEHQLVIQQLQEKISMLEVTSASQANLPSVGMSQTGEAAGLCSQVWLTPNGGLPSMTARTRPSHLTTNR